MEPILDKINLIADELRPMIEEISDFLFEHPELSGEEYQSAGYLAHLLELEGFQVTAPYAGISTAFRAEYGPEQGPAVCFLPEYDALPGYGPERRPAHACGHNWIGASCMGAALILSKLGAELPGRVVVLGSPAEETVGDKYCFVQQDAFRNIDAVFEMHLGTHSGFASNCYAMDSIEFTFHGKAAHAAAAPESGINALDAVNLTFNGINALRQHTRSDARIHGIVTNGGQAVNIVPELAQCRFYVRAADRPYVNILTEKVKNCARGAALMTGASLDISYFEYPFDNLKLNPVLEQEMKDCLSFYGISVFDEPAVCTGSSDVGIVSYTVPTVYGHIGVGDKSANIHEEAFLPFVNSPEAKEKLLITAKAMAAAAYRVLRDEDFRGEVHQTF